MPKKKTKKTPAASLKNADALVEELNLMFGDNYASTLNDIGNVSDPKNFISTGIYGLDKKIGGGFRRGAYSEVYGPEGSGKTTLCLQAAAQATKNGEKVVFIDCEYALNTDYVKAFGIDESLFIMTQPDTGEQVFDVMRHSLKTADVHNIGLIIVDSVAAMMPSSDEQTDQMASHARMIAKEIKKTTVLMGGRTAILLINQNRSKIGISFGNPTIQTGGSSLKYAVSLKLELVRIGSVKEKDNIIGQRVKIKAVKNKLAAPHQNREFDLIYGKGFDVISDIIETAMANRIIVKSGGWFNIPSEEKSIQGKNSVVAYYTENEDELEHLKVLIEESNEQK